MTADLLGVYGRYSDRLMVWRFLVCCNGFEIAVVLTARNCELKVLCTQHNFYSL
jgi:hypothetical protein